MLRFFLLFIYFNTFHLRHPKLDSWTSQAAEPITESHKGFVSYLIIIFKNTTNFHNKQCFPLILYTYVRVSRVFFLARTRVYNYVFVQSLPCVSLDLRQGYEKSC